jgi:hypothetical protein
MKFHIIGTEFVQVWLATGFKKDSTRFASSKAGAVDAGADHEKRKEEVVETIRPVASILLDI